MVLTISMWTAKTLIRLGKCQGRSESSCGAQSLCTLRVLVANGLSYFYVVFSGIDIGYLLD